MSPKTHPGMPFISKYSIDPDTHAQNEMKEFKKKEEKSTQQFHKKRTKSKQHRQYHSAAVFNNEVCILLDVFQLLFVSVGILPQIQKKEQ